MSLQESPFVGCRIRIISKAKIRYEGYLFSIDTDTPNDPVITLSKVWSFGTEDRPSERPVGPRSEVYEKIVFRGRDLEDVRVIQSSVFLNDDPSIVSAEPGSVSASQEQPRKDGDAPDIWTSPSAFGGIPKPVPISPINRPPSIEKSSALSFPNFMSPKPPADLLPELSGNSWNTVDRLSAEIDRPPVIHSVTPGTKDTSTDACNRNKPYSNQHDSHDDRLNTARGRGSYSNRNFRSNYSGGQKYSHKSQNEYQETRRADPNQGLRRGNIQSSFSRGVGGRGRNQQYKSIVPHRSAQLADDFEEEYDIEKANAELAEELEKLEISTQGSVNGSVHEKNGADTVKEGEECYDSKKSFFDTISSEMMDRSQGINRRSGRDDRRHNVDTFGPAASRMTGNYRGGNRYNNNLRRIGEGYYGGSGRRGGPSGHFGNSGSGSYNWSNDKYRSRQPDTASGPESNAP